MLRSTLLLTAFVSAAGCPIFGNPPAAPSLSVSPPSLAFGDIKVGRVSAGQTVTLTNTGDAVLNITNIAVQGVHKSDFATTAQSAYAIGPGLSVNFDVTFDPLGTGERSANLVITSNDAASPAIIGLSGTGVEPQPPTADVTPVAIDFGPQKTNTTSTPEGVTVTNIGDETLDVTNVSVSGNFAADAQASYTIAPGNMVSFNVTFTPTSDGAKAGQIDITSNDPSGIATVLLSGQGQQTQPPTAAIDPTTHDFGIVTVTQSSVPFPVTLGNTGEETLEVASLNMTGANPGDFTTDAQASYSIPAGQSVGFNVTFAPTNAGARSAALQIHSNDPDSPATLSLSGEGGSGGGSSIAVSPPSVSLGSVVVGSSTAATTVAATNNDVVPHTLNNIAVSGANAGDFILSGLPLLPVALNPGQSASAGVAFAPTATGARNGQLIFSFDSGAIIKSAPLSGTGTDSPPPPVGQVVYRINAGGGAYVDTSGNTWSVDQFYNTGNSFISTSAIAGTNDDVLYQSERWDPATAPELIYSLPLDDGSYDVRLHFAENFVTAANERVFNVLLEGQPALTNYDIFAAADFETAVIESFTLNVSDGTLNIEFGHVIENPKISAIEVLTAGGLDADVTLMEWGHVGIGATGDVKNVTLTNNGDVDITIASLAFNVNQGVGHDFEATIGGAAYKGGHADVNHTVNVPVPAGQSIVVPVQFMPTEDSDNDVNLVFSGNFGPVSVRLRGTGGEDTGHPFLHAVIVTDPYVVDYDGNGSEPVTLVGQFSHTHQIGHALTAFEWRENSVLFSTAQDVIKSFALGDHTVTLTIYDDNSPPETLSGSETFSVVSPNAVPGAIALYYPAGGAGGANAFLTSVPANASYAEALPAGLSVAEDNGAVGGSPYSTFVMVRMLATVDIDTAANYQFIANGGNETRLLLEGALVSGAQALSPGLYDIDARFAVENVTELPINVAYSINGGAQMPIDPLMLTHDQITVKPVINSMPTSGLETGGDVINIAGLGFFPGNQVKVHWGAQILSGGALNVTPTQITMTTPSGTGSIQVKVETPNGFSNAVTYTYNFNGPAPVQFDLSDFVGGLDDVTAGTIGPDRRLYVAELDGTIHAITFNANYQVTNTQTITTLQGLSNNNILGITTSPFEAPGVVKLYVAHGELFANGGSCFNGFSAYSGEISLLTGPNFNSRQSVISQLPVSNHDHGVNGIEFDDNGYLLICVGGNTNAGIPHCNMGGLEESPFSAAILRANVFKADFNGAVNYIDPATCLVNNDQVFGRTVRVAHGVDIDVFGAGLRNPLDLAYTASGRIYATDNGPNEGFGSISTGPNSQVPIDDNVGDELNHIDIGRYYGSPNRNRGDLDLRQNIYRHPLTATVPGDFEAAMMMFPSSTNGLIEYRANTFNGGLRGELIAQRWNGQTYRIKLAPNGKSVTSNSTLFTTFSVLNLVDAPGGVILGIDYTSDKIMKAIPNDVAATSLTVYDIFPYRARAAGGNTFIVSGANFGTLANTTVSIGGVQATLNSVTNKRITGVLPAGTAGPALLDVVVTVGADSKTLTNAFKYLRTPAADYGAQARFFVSTGGNIFTSSTYGSESFNLVNESTGGQSITRFRVDNSTSIIPDSVFDPFGVAGDPVGKDFTFDDGQMQVTSVTWSNPHHGGFDVLELAFSNFSPGKTLSFSADMDPTNIKDAPQPGPNDSGSISGLELTGARVYVEFDDGSIVEGELFAVNGSEIDSNTTSMFVGAPPAPHIEVQGICAPQIVSNASQTVKVTGPPGYGVRLLHAEAGLYLDGVPGGGFDVDPFEYNNVINVTHKSEIIGGSGSVSIPVTLTKSETEAGYNIFSAVLVDAQGNEGDTSQTLVLQLN